MIKVELVIAAFVIVTIIIIAALYISYVQRKELDNKAAKLVANQPPPTIAPPNSSINQDLLKQAVAVYDRLTLVRGEIDAGQASADAIKLQLQTGGDADLEKQYEMTLFELDKNNSTYDELKKQLNVLTSEMSPATHDAFVAATTTSGPIIDPNTEIVPITKEMIEDAKAKGIAYYQIDYQVWIETNAVTKSTEIMSPEDQKAAYDKIESRMGEVGNYYFNYKTAMDKLASDPALQKSIVAEIQATTGITDVSLEFDGTESNRTIDLTSQ